MPSQTGSESRVVGGGGPRQAPGALLVFSGNQPLFARIDLSTTDTIWGRGNVSGIQVADGQMSQAHLKIRWDAGSFKLFDMSRHGTFVNGQRIPTEQLVTARGEDVVRMGRTLVILKADVTEYRGFVESLAEPDGRTVIVGPRVRPLLDRVASARERRKNVFIHGENGTGKELLATHYHRAAKKPGPLVPVNCATLNKTTAGAVLFGTARGAFTDVRPSTGLIGAADGGVLFLDEIAELEDQVQSDFLRVLESGRYRITGDRDETAVQLNVVTASHQVLRDLVSSGKFRQDLYFRLNQDDCVELPSLRERREEIPWLMNLETRKDESELHHSAVEHALLQPWPGNLRELRNATSSATARAVQRFKEEAPARRLEHIRPEDDGPAEVRKIDFDQNAGAALARTVLAIPRNRPSPPPSVYTGPLPPNGNGSPPSGAPAAARAPDPNRSKEAVLGALERNNYNIKKSAEELGLNRTQLYREMDKHGIKRPGEPPPSPPPPPVVKPPEVKLADAKPADVKPADVKPSAKGAGVAPNVGSDWQPLTPAAEPPTKPASPSGTLNEEE